MNEVVDAELVDGHTELEPVPVGPSTTLFRTDNPVEVVKRASEAADALKSVLTKQGLTTNIQGKEHVNVEGWQTLGAMLGVSPVCTWTRKLGDPEGWEARVEAHNSEGRVIGAAEAECLRTESSWSKRDDYALRSMAQTRATSKALASVLRFVVTLAGYSGTPAEEMPREGFKREGGDTPSDKQLKFLGALLAQNGVEVADLDLVQAWGGEGRGLTGGKEGTCSRAIEALKNGDAEQKAETLRFLVGKAKAWDAAKVDPDVVEFEA